MCNNPTVTPLATFSCNRCNDCLQTKTSGWTYRAVAEMSQHEFTYILALTYDDATQSSKDGASVFRYSDIQGFFKLLRYYAKQKNPLAEIRYIVCGEMGSKKGRVHWHVVIYSNIDITDFGGWVSFSTKKTITEKNGKITVDPNRVKRVIWTLWKHGFISIQIPDAGGMAYALKYAFKDQFNAVKSKGTMREAKSENYSASFFRMSKRPPIGANWLFSKLKRLDELNSVLPSIRLKIPDASGYYVPQRFMLDALLQGLIQINQRCVDQFGRPAPQWSSLLASVVHQPKIWETLLNVQPEPEKIEDVYRDIKGRRKYDARDENAKSASYAIRQRCGGIQPCSDCVRGFSDSDTAAQSREYTANQILAYGSAKAAQRGHTQLCVCNPFCCLRNSPTHQRPFNA